MSTIVLCGGGTAGHVMPALALVPQLKRHFDEIIYIGTADSIEENLAKKHGLAFYSVTSAKLRRKLTFKNLSIPVKLLRGISESKKLLKKIKPSAVFSKGGYAALPVVIAAHRLKIPVVAHESDLTPGLSNRLSAKYCVKVCASFKECAERFNEKGVYTRSPIRESIYRGDKNKIVNLHSLNTNKKTILVTGGSSGAKSMNRVLRESIDSLTGSYNIIHLTGKGNTEDLKKSGYTQIEFTDNIADYYAAADLVISRAGANTVFELLSLCKPSLLIPLPTGESRGDQIENAEYFKARGCVRVLSQENLTSEAIVKEIELLKENADSLVMSIKGLNLSPGNGNIVSVIYNAAFAE